MNNVSHEICKESIHNFEPATGVDNSLLAPLDYYARHGAALFPLPRGSKAPHGIVPSFKHDHSSDREQWRRWAIDNPGCNFGVVAFASQWITLDTDTSGGEAGRAEAWAMRAELFASWGLDPATPPHLTSARGGWHDYFAVPPHIDAATLRQPDAIKGRINIRVVGYTVAAGSYYNGMAKGEQSGPYVLSSDAPPHPAPAALIEHCTRKPRKLDGVSLPGDLDKGDVAALLRWMADHDCFAAYEDWLTAGMALKIDGDDGSLWDICHDGSVSPSAAAAKWESFSSAQTADSVTIRSLMKRAHAAGWTGTVRKSAAAMFSDLVVVFDEETKTWKITGPEPIAGPEYPHVPPAVATGASPWDEEEDEKLTQVTLEDFLGYLPMNQFIYIKTRALWPAASINSTLGSIVVGQKEVTDPETNETSVVDVKMPASQWLNRNRAVACMTWAPGYPMLMRDTIAEEGGWVRAPGQVTFNQYLGPTIEHKAGDASLWVNHVHHVYPDDAEHIIAWCAHRVQFPQEKINHALVLGGGMGIGKDTILEPVRHAIGPWNFREIKPAQLLSQFNGYVKCVILRISEARDLGDQTRNEFYESMKTLAAAPPPMHPTNEKHLKEHYVPNICGPVITTNHLDGLYIPPDDRRYYVAWSSLKKEDFTAEYWDGLYDWFESGGNEIVAEYLANLDLSGFNPKKPPPKTPAWHKMVNMSRAPEDAEMADALEKLGNPDAVTISMVVPRAGMSLQLFLQDRRNSRSVWKRFEGCEYVAIDNPDAKDGLWRVSGKRQAVYAKAALSEHERVAAARDLGVPPLPY